MTDLSFIVKVVIYKCRELGNPVTETLAAYVAQTMLNSCKNNYHIISHHIFVYSYWIVLFGELDCRGRCLEIGRFDHQTVTTN